VVALKLQKLVFSCYLCSLALTPYDLNVLNNCFKNAMKRRKKRFKHDKKENNLTITAK
jgi:hypothetical protein